MIGKKWMYGINKRSDLMAIKAMGNELKGLNSIWSVLQTKNITNFQLPLMCIIDHLGHRLCGISKLPIEQKGSLVYGTCNAGYTLFNAPNDQILKNLITEISEGLNLAEHTVTEYSSHQKKSMKMAADFEVHKVVDKDTNEAQYYGLDFARVLPPNDPYEPLLHQFRPEYLRRIYHLKLSPDAFTGFGEGDKSHNNTVLDAIAQLNTTIESISENLRQKNTDADLLMSWPGVKEYLHKSGINLRFMGKIYNLMDVPLTDKSIPSVGNYIMEEMIYRSAKSCIRHICRSISAEFAIPISGILKKALFEFSKIFIPCSDSGHIDNVEWWISKDEYFPTEYLEVPTLYSLLEKKYNYKNEPHNNLLSFIFPEGSTHSELDIRNFYLKIRNYTNINWSNDGYYYMKPKIKKLTYVRSDLHSMYPIIEMWQDSDVQRISMAIDIMIQFSERFDTKSNMKKIKQTNLLHPVQILPVFSEDPDQLPSYWVFKCIFQDIQRLKYVEHDLYYLGTNSFERDSFNQGMEIGFHRMWKLFKLKELNYTPDSKTIITEQDLTIDYSNFDTNSDEERYSILRDLIIKWIRKAPKMYSYFIVEILPQYLTLDSCLSIDILLNWIKTQQINVENVETIEIMDPITKSTCNRAKLYEMFPNLLEIKESSLPESRSRNTQKDRKQHLTRSNDSGDHLSPRDRRRPRTSDRSNSKCRSRELYPTGAPSIDPVRPLKHEFIRPSVRPLFPKPPSLPGIIASHIKHKPPPFLRKKGNK
eukprot:TRINITY_DN9055_c0_g1_i1.p1 TRINITY_DN9055_c0_g1~~TRINITY_DN9055_c0_g1_i1.p1  ORF type:complete len:758 (-),score=103.39 TRINITY_DN9055_c0_g1_i1:200-2473(-)